MALDRAPEPAMILPTRTPLAPPLARALITCALAAFPCALTSALHAGELPPAPTAETPADASSQDPTDPDADLSPSIAPLSWQVVPLDTHLTATNAAPSQSFLADWTVAASADISIPNAAQIRIHFAEWFLPGDDAIDGAMLRITSLADGATQTLGPAQMRAWSGAPAFFNGNSVRVELLVRGSRDLWSNAFLRTAYAHALDASYSTRSICGSTDDRVPVSDPIMARVWPIGCSATIIQDANACFLTAGHCGPASGSVVQFNVPLSTTGGVPVSPPPSDQFPVDFLSVQRQSDGSGQDWSYFGALVNTTNLTPRQRQGGAASLALAAPATPNTPLRISGFGTTSSPISPTWNQALKTHAGPLFAISGTRLRHQVDTTGGNSGSGILLDDNQPSRTIVGIHTHAGCSTSTTSANTGTVIQHPNLQAALASPLGICASGSSIIESSAQGQVWIGQDAANNLGILQVDAPAGAFASRLSIPGIIQAMAADNAHLYAITHDLRVFAIDPQTAQSTNIAIITNAAGTAMPTITGLAITSTGQWYAVAQSTSELFSINPSSFLAQRVASLGSPGVLRLGALETDADPRFLLALDDATSGTRLIEIDLQPVSPTHRVVGTLGAGALDCNALTRTSDGRWITADAATDRVLQINRQTGAATVLANLQGTFLAAGGMAWAGPAPCIADIDQSGGIDGQDLSAFFGVFESGDPAADLNASGGVEADDIAVFIQAFERGC